MGQTKRNAAVAGEFDESWSTLLGSPGWWPDRTQAECARMAREAGGPAAALGSDRYVDVLGASLRKWRAFRGVAFDRDRFVAAMRGVAPLLERWRGVSILSLRPGRMAELFELFDAVRDIKPTERKWVASSKALHHLLPDLIVPMDNLMTAPFLGTSALPATMEPQFLERAYSAFAELATGIGSTRLRAAGREVPYPVPGYGKADCRIGQARVVDFAIAGFVLRSGPSRLREL